MLKYAIDQLRTETRENLKDFDEIRKLKGANTVLAGLIATL
jgi:hypothetical protein